MDPEPFDLDRGSGAIATFAHPTQSVEQAPPHQSAILDQALANLIPPLVAKAKAGAPIAVLVNGFMFRPQEALVESYHDADNPHQRIFHFLAGNPSNETRHHSTGWPAHLGFAADDQGGGGLVVPFGWYSWPGFLPTLLNEGRLHYRAAYGYADESSWPFVAALDALARVIAGIPKIKATPIDIVCHSLGSALVIRALSRMAKYNLPVLGRIGRVIIMGGSEYTSEARLTNGRLLATANTNGWDVGTGPMVYNLGSRENSVLDLMAENLAPRPSAPAPRLSATMASKRRSASRAGSICSSTAANSPSGCSRTGR
ncbi:alpha/beta hydrolase [Oleomonas cavernae]|uniref:Alpha/beta hydrolase n=1 Tax=Oleomonas cavernae TaxID=2320859 RepID=A0A418WD80_9PROT|nr:alpha/beta hydrolase [Oleomonas cavernae]